ncbi:MAG: hypothetical protein COA32_13050 [Fluviicola sp.]|nr:MAG: hypothetical protein COA32_13050 [Fluviicola sp.]
MDNRKKLRLKMGKKIKVAICSNEIHDDIQLWVNACNDYKSQIDYVIIDLTLNDWLDKIRASEADYFLLKPSGYNESFKQLYDERVLIMEEELKLKVFPSRKEIFIYENKRFLSFWLNANAIPHPNTNIFYFRKEAIKFINTQPFPIVSKTNIGASGSGVKILKNENEAVSYINDIFDGKGADNRVGPNLKKKKILQRALKLIINPKKLKAKIFKYSIVSKSLQNHFVIFQKFIPHSFEWRVVRIGDSFFAHKKMLNGEKASGSLIKSYDNPPLDLFDFVKEITDKHNFYSQAIDVFESNNGYLVNEMQCIFGQSDAFQMKVKGKVGRYIWKKQGWQFEEGDFNKNESFNLRIEYILSKL